MGKINIGRVVLGGLLAGLIFNLGEFLLNNYFLRELWEWTLKSLNKAPMGSEVFAMVFYVILGFALGIFSVWVYAAIRPRFAPGPATAICAGLIVWFLTSMYSSAVMLPMHLFPRRLLLYSVVWEFVLIPLATVVGAWAYKE